MSLSHKFALFSLLLGAILIFQWTTSIIRERRVLIEEAEERAGVLSRTIAELAREPLIYGGLGQLNRQVASFMEERDVEYIFICDSNSMVVAASDKNLPGWTISNPQDGFSVLRWTKTKLLARVPIIIPGKNNAYVEMAISKARLNLKIYSGVMDLIKFLLLELLLSFIFMAIMYRQLFIPIKSLVKNLNQAKPDKPYSKLYMPVFSAPELLQIAEAVDDLQQRAIEYRNEMLKDEKLATIGRMAAEVAHEIRNPLTAISGAAELIGDLIVNDNIYVKILKEEVQNLNSYLSDILDFSKLGSRHAECCDIAKICEAAIKLASTNAKDKGIKIIVELDTCFATIVKNEVQRVILNLILNAIEASNYNSCVELKLQKLGSYACITITDEGTGIDNAVKDKIFEPFFTTKANGTGLGLSLARRAVEDQGGTLSLKSRQGKGTIAELCLPVNGV